MKIDHLINGKSVAGSDYFETINPATQQVLAEVASGGEAEVNAAVAAAKEAFPKWAATPASERAKIMRKLGDLITKHVPEISETETQDCGQTISQTGKQLVPRAADNFHYFAEMCTRVDGHTYPTPTHLNYTLFHPVGVCALISPWNVPFMTATWKVAPCLAFGNTAVLKMSELSPLTAARLGELALEAGVPPGVLNLVHGYGKEAGEPLVSHRDVRAISFTGSTVTGNRIVQSAGLKKFSMELGGKSPFVIFEDADLDRALDAAVHHDEVEIAVVVADGHRRVAVVAELPLGTVSHVLLGDVCGEEVARLPRRSHSGCCRRAIRRGARGAAGCRAHCRDRRRRRCDRSGHRHRLLGSGRASGDREGRRRRHEQREFRYRKGHDCPSPSDHVGILR